MIQSFAQITFVPDANFEKALIEQGIDSDNMINGQFPTVNAVGVSYLDVSSKNISSMVGIEAFTNLDTLICARNNLSTIDISNNTNLTYFDCFLNPALTNLDLSSNVNLTYLNYAGNTLSNVDLSNNINLTHLNCAGNIISNLDLSNNINLTYLDCSFNEISNLDLSNKVNLEHLNCSRNDLFSLDVSNNINLTHLDCSYDSLSSINLSNNISLNYFNCHHNQIVNLDLSNNINLNHLDCLRNHLLGMTLPSSANITHLDCAYNVLPSLDVSSYVNLEYLHCADNILTNLDLSNNVNIDHFDCSDNQITNLDLSNQVNMTKVDCAGNRFTSIDFSNNTLLWYLKCSHNTISSLDLSNNPLLTELECSYSLLTQLDLSNNPNLSILHCESNQLTNLDLSNNPSIWELNCFRNSLTQLDVSHLSFLSILNCSINQLEEIFLGHHHPAFYDEQANIVRSFTCQGNSPYLIICGYIPSTIPSHWQKDASAVYSSGGCFPERVSGLLTADMNTNCIADSSEGVFDLALIKIYNGLDTVIVSASDGSFSAGLDTGTYFIEAIPSNNLWRACSSPQTFTVDTTSVQNIDFVIQPLILCPLLTVDISAPFLRMTGSGSNYIINYCNEGTLPAYGVYIDVDIDPGLNVLNTSLPIASQNGNVYTFLLDTVDIFECGSFHINVIVDTSAVLGQTHCTEAHIHPDTVCGISWLGPEFELSDSCTGDSIYFELTNIGTDMQGNLNYFVFEDDLMLHDNPFFLLAGETFTISVPTNSGKTYRFRTESIPNFPSLRGDGFVTKAIENCNPSTDPTPMILTSYVLSQYNGNSAPAIALDCQQNVFAYDPNDKTAQPEGYSTQHYIEKNTPLNYRIRFQNTGNDTAFTVVLKDTLSPYLDLSSLQMGSSSHPYTWTINNNILTIRFDHIMLPDSNTNEPASNGFVKYAINQVNNLPLETRIENTAYIYFDYNPPIITNTTFHTIGENIYRIEFTDNANQSEELETTNYIIFPNPTQDLITVQQDMNRTFSLEVFHINGQLLQSYQDLNGEFQFNLNHYPAGTYTLRIQDEQQVNTYKVIKHR
ncbi:MAG: T9SS type A sorting domain-containing protein [Saprospiraceae bacterium]|nr:T9SS type A sorting domain-containing protein [Saprospiraceae bacterium]